MSPQEQARTFLTQAAGYVGIRTLEMGLRHGLLQALAEAPRTAPELARVTGLDPFYVRVWCRAAYASEALQIETPAPDAAYLPDERRFADDPGPIFALAPHVDTLFLDAASPGYIGGIPTILVQPELFDVFADNLPTGEGLWWEDCSEQMIRAVSGTGLPFYTRMIPDGLDRVKGLREQLEAGCAVTELCSGSGRGLIRLARTFPECRIVGVDGDAHSCEVARKRIAEAGLADRIEVVHSALEELALTDQDLVWINISMHECRDIGEVTRRVWRALSPGGTFVISDFPFPESTEATRSVPGRIMSGIQFFEAVIGDQLMATRDFVELLRGHEFTDVESFDLAPVHAVTVGRRP